jgi:hypothetical protein
MKRRLAQFAIAFLMLVPCAQAADSLDRIVATVNRQPVLASDVDDEAHFEAIEQGRAPSMLDGDRRAVLNRVIQRELICQQMPDTFEPAEELIDAHIAELRAQFPAVITAAEWDHLLANYGFDDQTLRDNIKLQLKVVHFLDLRLRPTVRVDHDEITEYYSTKLVPKLKAAGAKIEPLDQLNDKISEVLIQQKMTEVFNAWTANLRSQGNVRILDPDLAPLPASLSINTK